MGFEKIFVVKGNMPDDAQPVCKDTEFKSIAEMPIDVHLPDGGVGGGMGRHGAVGGFIGIKGIVQIVGFFKGFELFDNAVVIFGIVFRHLGFNAGGIEERHGCFFQINPLADRFGQINKVIKHRL